MPLVLHGVGAFLCTYLRLALLLHKKATAKYILHSTVPENCPPTFGWDIEKVKQNVPVWTKLS